MSPGICRHTRECEGGENPGVGLRECPKGRGPPGAEKHVPDTHCHRQRRLLISCTFLCSRDRPVKTQTRFTQIPLLTLGRIYSFSLVSACAHIPVRVNCQHQGSLLHFSNT